MLYRRILFLSFIGSVAMIITGISLMPPTGGTIPQNTSVEQYQQEQRVVVLNSDGFKLAMAGSAIAILTLILLARSYILEEEVEVRNLQVVPYPLEVKKKPEELKEVIVVGAEDNPQRVVTHELLPPRFPITTKMALPVAIPLAFPAGPRGPRGPIPPFRTFNYPPPYEAFNKK
jgi:sulfur transfer complex TusBCD TusB component (DsrH family)